MVKTDRWISIGQQNGLLQRLYYETIRVAGVEYDGVPEPQHSNEVHEARAA